MEVVDIWVDGMIYYYRYWGVGRCTFCWLDMFVSKTNGGNVKKYKNRSLGVTREIFSVPPTLSVDNMYPKHCSLSCVEYSCSSLVPVPPGTGIALIKLMPYV